MPKRSNSRHSTARGVVVQYVTPAPDYPHSHERATRTAIARRLAVLKNFDFGGDYDPDVDYGAPLYFVPGETLSIQAAAALGIRTVDDFFGGVVPHAYVGTKVITHPLIAAEARAPDGWSSCLGDELRHAVLFGYSAFSGEDAREAGRRVLARGAARVKRPCGLGGRGQQVVAGADELDAFLDSIEAGELCRDGVVIETNYEAVTTFSVGQVSAAGIVATYCGTQLLTTDNAGQHVYGGSELFVARGGFDSLTNHDIASEAAEAIVHARTYDDAVTRAYPGTVASRKNYDVARGLAPDGRWVTGVLEQSWRIGGASSAELAALDVFLQRPDVVAVRTSCVELYGADAVAPDAAVVSFRGRDDRVGDILKYSTVHDYVYA